jgi:CheY-like chemotaxis protein
MRVLIADDHPLFRLGLKAGLEAQGLAVVAEAENGLEALDKALALKPDAVLLDLRMPGMDGLTCARKLRERGYRGLIAFLTTYQEPALLNPPVHRLQAQAVLIKSPDLQLEPGEEALQEENGEEEFFLKASPSSQSLSRCRGRGRRGAKPRRFIQFQARLGSTGRPSLSESHSAAFLMVHTPSRGWGWRRACRKASCSSGGSKGGWPGLWCRASAMGLPWL